MKSSIPTSDAANGITRRDSLKTAIAAAFAPIVALQAESGGLTDHEAWVLERFRESSQKDRDIIERLLVSFQKDAPLPPGWWVEGEGRERMPMNQRDAAEMRALVASDRAWRAAKQAQEVQ